MKIRNGLVSNSSSSSFICLIKEKAFNEAKSKSGPYVVAVLDAVSTSRNIFGEDIFEIATWDGNSFSWDEYIDLDFEGEIPLDKYNEEMSPTEALDSFLDTIRDEDMYSASVDW